MKAKSTMNLTSLMSLDEYGYEENDTDEEYEEYEQETESM